MKDVTVAMLIALVASVLVAWPVYRWEKAHAKKRWHIQCWAGPSPFLDFWTTNPTYVGEVWITNGVLVRSEVVTNKFK